MSDSSEHIGGFVRDLGEAARSNPVSAALIGMGALWLFTGRSQRAVELVKRSGIDQLPDVARDAWEGAASGVRSGSRNIGEAASEAAGAIRRQGEQAMEEVADVGERIVGSASDYTGRAGDLFDDARDGLTDLFRSQPLAIGAVGLAIGAAIAAAIPTTQTEGEYLGESSEFVRQKASEIAGEQVERATAFGEKVAAAVADEAQQQGLTPDRLKAAASELSDKAARVANAVTTKSGS
ncbi:MAG: hypothetical protein ACRC1G_12045 [Bradyrhizobium sp.]|nr:hypothetical protein [Bradyrhizobium sp.]